MKGFPLLVSIASIGLSSNHVSAFVASPRFLGPTSRIRECTFRQGPSSLTGLFAAEPTDTQTKGLDEITAELRGHKDDFDNKINGAETAKEFEEIRRTYLGKKGPVNQAMRYMRLLPNEDKPKLGVIVNEIKDQFEKIIQKRKVEIDIAEIEARMPSERLDVTMPGLPRHPNIGRRHPLSLTMEKAIDIFVSLGYDTVTETEDSPEIETDYYCFEALNCPKDHPARDMQDTFYITENRNFLLRTHTSSVQIRQLEKRKPPLRIVAPGRVYRRDDIDATHSPMFHQVEILAVEKRGNLDLGHLKGTVEHFLKNMFGPDIPVRFRGSYFPFTEPSMEVDVYFNDKWLEVLGCGMVDPSVLEMAGLDPNEYCGFAAGFGVERFAMVIYGITDIREFTKSDVRFLEQFPHYADDGWDTFLRGEGYAEPEEDYRRETMPSKVCYSMEELKEFYEQNPDDEGLPIDDDSDLEGGGEGGKGKKKEKKKKEKKKQANAGGSGEIDVSKLDIRVGVITRAWEHEEADKLFCEEIDIGEDEPRQIASGLRAYYNLEDLKGQRVLVLANLKTRKMLGFPSHGMILCASNGDKVEFLEPPEGAQVGERVMVEGYDGEPATENQIIKKKMLDAIFPELKTNGDGIATYKGVPFTTSAGVCKAQNGMPDAAVS